MGNGDVTLKSEEKKERASSKAFAKGILSREWRFLMLLESASINPISKNIYWSTRTTTLHILVFVLHHFTHGHCSIIINRES